MLTIYHGSQKIIKNPIFGGGNPNNDYGLGFYCTEAIDLAKEWACSSEENGYANEYTIKMDKLKILSLTDGEYNILNWLFVLLENRKFRIDGNIAIQAKTYIDSNFSIEYKNYDIIKGYRADDSYFSFATEFLNNGISISQLEKAMVLGKLGEQIVLKSKKAFDNIKFNKAISVDKEIYYPKKLARDTQARSEFRAEKNKLPVETEIYILDIMRERWKNDHERLQRIVLR